MMPDFLPATTDISLRINRFKEILNECHGCVVFLGGAGVSTGSGIPDFRSKDGLYNNIDPEFKDYQPEYLLSHECFEHNKDVFYKFYRKFLDVRDYEPCIAHKKLAELEQNGTLSGIVTQNVDMLHEYAGSKNVMKIHGTIGMNHCTKCGKTFGPNWFFDNEDLKPKCNNCGGIVRPDVVLYEEQMPMDVYEKAIRAIEDASCLIVAGTSLQVGTAAYLVQNYHGRYLVILNNQPTPFDQWADIVFHEDLNQVFEEI